MLLFANPWAWGVGALLAVGIFFSGYGCSSVRSAKKTGEMQAEIKAQAAVLAELKSQQEDLRKQRDLAQAREADVRVVTVDRIREHNAPVIGPGCDAAMLYTRGRVPVLVVHRRMEATQ